MVARVLFLLCAIGAFASPLFLWSGQKGVFVSNEDHEVHDAVATSDVAQILTQLISRQKFGSRFVGDATDRTSLYLFVEDHLSVGELMFHEALLKDVKDVFAAAPSQLLLTDADSSDVLSTVAAASNVRLFCLHPEDKLCAAAKASLKLTPVASLNELTAAEDGLTVVCLGGRPHDHGEVIKTLAARNPSMTAAFLGLSSQNPHPHHHAGANADDVPVVTPSIHGAKTTYTGHIVDGPILMGVLFMILFAVALFCFIYMSLCLQTPEGFEGDPIPGSKQK